MVGIIDGTTEREWNESSVHRKSMQNFRTQMSTITMMLWRKRRELEKGRHLQKVKLFKVTAQERRQKQEEKKTKREQMILLKREQQRQEKEERKLQFLRMKDRNERERRQQEQRQKRHRDELLEETRKKNKHLEEECQEVWIVAEGQKNNPANTAHEEDRQDVSLTNNHKLHEEPEQMQTEEDLPNPESCQTSQPPNDALGLLTESDRIEFLSFYAEEPLDMNYPREPP
jgi:hypothetical protein